MRGNNVSGDVSWVRAGSRPLVLLHGFLGTRGTMQPLTRRFRADGRAVFSYHVGTFQLESMVKSAEVLRDRLEQIVTDLEVDRVDVVGFSMGGLVAMHTLKFLQGDRYIRRLVTLGSPFRGTWLAAAGVATIGLISPSVWQVMPHSPFLNRLRTAPMPAGVRVRQIHARHDALCPAPGPLDGVDPERDYIMLPGGHSTLVVARHVYPRIREFIDAEELTIVRGGATGARDDDAFEQRDSA
ncbi:MAG: alpha/beta fold hydrolase [Myxococcales bacterium]|nr:alpha/beta fold hydrolase [Myxococcales bacterium]MCB9750262.1 alpha/beta fold hydrolase [Myxococcales bacterium]